MMQLKNLSKRKAKIKYIIWQEIIKNHSKINEM